MQVNSSSIYAYNPWSDTAGVANANNDERATRSDSSSGERAYSQPTQSALNFADEVPEQVARERSVEANSQATRTHDETLGTTINIKV